MSSTKTKSQETTGPLLVYYAGIFSYDPSIVEYEVNKEVQKAPSKDRKPSRQLVAALCPKHFNLFTRGTAFYGLSQGALDLAQHAVPGERGAVVLPDKVSLGIKDIAIDARSHFIALKNGICGVVVTSQAYASTTAQGLIGRLVSEFLAMFPDWTSEDFKVASEVDLGKEKPSLSGVQGTLEAKLKSFRGNILKQMDEAHDPKNFSALEKIQNELKETRVVLERTVEEVLNRGEKLDMLVGKSDALQAESQQFYKGAKQQNSFCKCM